MENSGWIRLHRKIMEHPDWLSEPFTRVQAWIDLLLLANHRMGHIRKRGILVQVNRGEVGYSEQSLATRWKWSREKVRRFLRQLRANGQISRNPIQQNPNISLLISITNYELYQSGETTNETTEKQQTRQEQKEKEEKERILSDPQADPDFMLFYKTYPKRQARVKAYQAWKKIGPSNGLLETILAAIGNQKTAKDQLKQSGLFCPEWPMPATWLNQRRWDDEIEMPEKRKSSW